MNSSRPNDDQNPSGASLIGHAWSIVGAMIGCPLVGYFIGEKYGNVDRGVLIGAVVGFGYCFYELWKFIRKNK